MVLGGFFTLILLFRFGSLPVGLALIVLPTSIVVQNWQDNYPYYEDGESYDSEAIEAIEVTEETERLDYETVPFDVAPPQPVDTVIYSPSVEIDAVEVSEPLPLQIQGITLSEIAGTWIYSDILKNGVSVAQMQATDTLALFMNKEFQYDIEALSKHKKGTYELIEKEGISQYALVFYYRSILSNEILEVRTFDIEYLTEREMRISEGPLQFIFEKKITVRK